MNQFEPIDLTQLLKICIQEDHNHLEKSIVTSMIGDHTKLTALFEKSSSIIKLCLQEDNLEFLWNLLINLPGESELERIISLTDYHEKAFAWIYIILGSRNGLRVLGTNHSLEIGALSSSSWEKIKMTLNKICRDQKMSAHSIEDYTKEIFSRIHSALLKEYAL